MVGKEQIVPSSVVDRDSEQEGIGENAEAQVQFGDDAANDTNNTADDTDNDPSGFSKRQQHIAKIKSYWNLAHIYEALPVEFWLFNDERFESETLELLFNIAKLSQGIDRRGVTVSLITQRWNDRSEFSLDSPTGRSNTKLREEYLREDLQDVFVELQLSRTCLARGPDEERPGEDSVDAAGDQHPENSDTAPATISTNTRSKAKKRPSEGADAEPKAKRHEASSPTRFEDGAEHYTDDAASTRARLILQELEKRWDKAEIVVPNSMWNQFEHRHDATRWDEQALRGLCEMHRIDSASADPLEENGLRGKLWKAYCTRTTDPRETKELTVRDTDAVLHFLRCQPRKATVPGSSGNVKTNVQVLSMTAGGSQAAPTQIESSLGGPSQGEPSQANTNPQGNARFDNASSASRADANSSSNEGREHAGGAAPKIPLSAGSNGAAPGLNEVFGRGRGPEERNVPLPRHKSVRLVLTGDPEHGGGPQQQQKAPSTLRGNGRPAPTGDSGYATDLRVQSTRRAELEHEIY
ncbi:hypothetical protein IQ06DRAFT_358992 [Phaeosphaeriaceae sp. SRC1lsM3a]|nr:hypothetical protein IQ06DRAFT_358992 [Stagonospora sp. SRC1lsM3a]